MLPVSKCEFFGAVSIVCEIVFGFAWLLFHAAKVILMYVCVFLSLAEEVLWGAKQPPTQRELVEFGSANEKYQEWRVMRKKEMKKHASTNDVAVAWNIESYILYCV